MGDRSIFATENDSPQETTLLALVQMLTRQGRSEREIEDEVLDLVDCGRVKLVGSFRSHPLCPTRAESHGAESVWRDVPLEKRSRGVRSSRPPLASAHLGPREVDERTYRRRDLK